VTSLCSTRTPHSQLWLDALETIAATYVPRVLARLADRRPEIRVEVRPTASRDDLPADVIAGRACGFPDIFGCFSGSSG